MYLHPAPVRGFYRRCQRSRAGHCPAGGLPYWKLDHLLKSLVLPDLWQQEAVRALRTGQDVVVHAPTGAGKTWIFELLYAQLRGQAIFTVPTRALANDKLAEWTTRGWDVGIATGDLARNLDAKVVVATLETQKTRLLKREGPALLVIDEYQMIGDAVRGVNYELAVALAPLTTQLLLLSGSVANPADVVAWMKRLGRDAVLVATFERPVPLEEIDVANLPDRAPTQVRGWWPRAVFNALRADLGPVLLFAPRRQAAEDLATQIAGALPPADPLRLTPAQEQSAGSKLGKLLRARVAFHHSGLSYAQRAELIEPLAKAGQLRAVVATLGLAAGINFSMRSVGITGTSYMAGPWERQVAGDELLQMYGRAGRRGLDEVGYALVTERPPRLLDARARTLRRPAQVDWPALVAVMQAAVERGVEPFAAARELNERLFSNQQIPLGVEHSLETGPMPCGLWADMERARFARRGVVEIRGSTGTWEPKPAAAVTVPLGETRIWVPAKDVDGEGRWVPAPSLLRSVEGRGAGNVIRLDSLDGVRPYGRELALGTRRADGTLGLAPWLRRTLAKPRVDLAELERDVLAELPRLSGGGKLLKLFPRGEQLIAHLGFAEVPVKAWMDAAGVALQDPPERRELPLPCRAGADGGPCPQLEWCLGVPIVPSPSHAWRLLGLIEPDGRPTRRGIIFSWFQHGEGLAVAAALEDPGYAIGDLVWDLANLRAGARFSGDESPYSGRLAVLCQRTYARLDLEGYLSMGVPPEYGAGASEAVRSLVQGAVPRNRLLTDSVRMGDLERALLEWRSLLRHVTYAPAYAWERWTELKNAAAEMVRRESSL